MKMSNIILLSLIGIGMLTSFSFIYSAKQNFQVIPIVKIIGSSNVVNKSLNLEAFHSVEMDDIFTITMSSGPNKVEVQAEDNIMEFVSVQVQDGIIAISMDYPEHYQVKNIKPLIVTLQAPVFHKINVSGQSEVSLDGALVQDSITFNLEDQSIVKGEVRVKKLNISVLNQSSIHLSGMCESLSLEIEDQGKIAGESLLVDWADVNIDHQGYARLNVINQLSGEIYDASIIEVSGGGNVDSVRVRDVSKLTIVK